MTSLENLCAICYENIDLSNIRAAHPEKSDIFRHEFHFSCLAKWIKLDKLKCPICVTDLTLTESEAAYRIAISTLKTFSHSLAQSFLTPDVNPIDIFRICISNWRFDYASFILESNFEIDQEEIIKCIEHLTISGLGDTRYLTCFTSRLSSLSEDLLLKIIGFLSYEKDTNQLAFFIPTDASSDLLSKIRGKILVQLCNSDLNFSDIVEIIDIEEFVSDSDIIEAWEFLLDNSLEDIEEEKANFLFSRTSASILSSLNNDMLSEFINYYAFRKDIEKLILLISYSHSDELLARIRGIFIYQICLGSVSLEDVHNLINWAGPANESWLFTAWEALFDKDFDEYDETIISLVQTYSSTISNENKVAFTLENYEKNIKLAMKLVKGIEPLPVILIEEFMNEMIIYHNIEEFDVFYSMIPSITAGSAIKMFMSTIIENMPVIFHKISAKTAFIDPIDLSFLMQKCSEYNRSDLYELLLTRQESPLNPNGFLII